ncbi:hypothetical protein SERLA73DRAFT_189058 [Serpula lacrymans var. lacrymans S7.3]|uniref:CN hydrolase domain-containing protein n=1 Tax=Serpula lacrymans var. lacrymans (strain S7.3) TaxID=936435 RepID=F8QCR3_SERL3|nr:hypothetical protein SERLA73DRAFT_189058 [Serpula lacrymans var. lacrymans S7.3]
MASTTLRIAVVQFAPKIGQVHANIAKARELCKQIIPRSVDLVCLPEMIFTGYVFSNMASISPYLEHPHTGPTSRFCAELAQSLHCYVTAGYPERVESHDATISADRDGETLFGANSAVMYDHSGQLVTSNPIRKTNLFETDIPWAIPGTGFTTLSLPQPIGLMTLAICNDLNVQKPAVWSSLETGPYELAQHCIDKGTRLLVLLNAWLHHDQADKGGNESEQDEGKITDSSEPDRETLNYWALRLRPLWAAVEEARAEAETTAEAERIPEELIVVVSNRFGFENGAHT